MNGPVEETGKVASSAIEAMKAQPVCLALLIGWLMTLGFSYLALQRERDRTHEETAAMIERCFPVKSEGHVP
jgi:hypothetical protein